MQRLTATLAVTLEDLSAAMAARRQRMEPELRQALASGTNSFPVTEEEPCSCCRGAGFLRKDVPVGDPEFGKLVACPVCGPARQKEHEARVAQKISSECGLSLAQRKLGFENFERYPGNEGALKAAREFLEQGLEQRQWLVIAGKPGNGKTHLLCAIANGAIARGIPTLYAYTPDLLEHWRSGYRRAEEGQEAYGDFEERFERTRRVQLLLLDDLGTQTNTPWTREKLETLVDYRYREALPLVCTTNEDPSNVRALSERIYSRLERYEPHFLAVNRAIPYHVWRRQKREEKREEIPW